MRPIAIALLSSAFLFPQPAISAPGIVVEKIGGVWTATKPDGTAISCTGSPYCIQAAINYWASSGYPLHIYGLGKAEPFSFSATTIEVPAQFGGVLKCHACWFDIDNSGSALPGFNIDTQQVGAFLNTGGMILYKGNWAAVRVRPVTSVQGLLWTSWHHFDFGTIAVTGGTGAGIYFDGAQACGETQEVSTSIVDSKFYFTSIVGKGLTNIQFAPLNCVHQVVGENLIDFGFVNGATNAEIYIGNGGNSNPFDVGLGTNTFRGAVSHTATTGVPIRSNGSLGIFELNALNIFTSGIPNYIQYGPNACGNNVKTPQKFGATVADTTGGNSSCVEGANVLKRP